MIITFHLKKEWFDKIKSGKKTHEYREVKPYWDKRLEDNLCDDYSKYHPSVSLACFLCGYPTKREILYDNRKVCNAVIKSIKIVNGLETDLKIDKPVYDIEFELIKDGEEWQKRNKCKKISDCCFKQRTDGTFTPSSNYPDVYQALLIEYNTEVEVGITTTLPSGISYTKRGLSVKLSTEKYNDYDFVINSANSTFRLPINCRTD